MDRAVLPSDRRRDHELVPHRSLEHGTIDVIQHQTNSPLHDDRPMSRLFHATVCILTFSFSRETG